jgi:hypothetical protein
VALGGVSRFFLRLLSYSFGNMPNFKVVAYFLLVCTDSGGYVKFPPTYIIVGGEGVSSNFFKGSNHILLVTQDHMPNYKIVAYLLLRCTDSGGYVKFTPKYNLVGGKGGVLNLFLRFQ